MKLAQIIVPTNDELRVVQAGIDVTATYQEVVHHPLFPPALLAVFVLTLLLCVPSSRKGLFKFVSDWFYYALGTWGRYKMRKERKEQQRARLEAVIVDHIEEEVHQFMRAPQEHKHKYTSPEEAADWYRDYAGIHPTFRYALKKPADLRTRIHERRASQPRDEHGNIIPIPFPDSKKEAPVAVQPTMSTVTI